MSTAKETPAKTPARSRKPAAKYGSTTEAFCAVQAALASVGISKDSKNEDQGYKFRGIDALMNTLSPILAAHGVVVATKVVDRELIERQSRRGAALYHHIVTVEFTILSSWGEPIGPFASMGESIDSSDKGLNKAIGAAFKYWLFTTLCVPTDAHQDADAETPEAVSAQAQQAAPEAPQQAPQQAEVKLVGAGELEQVRKMLADTGTDEAMYTKFLQLDSLEQLPLSRFAKTMEQLKRKKAKLEQEEQRAAAAQAAQEEAQQFADGFDGDQS
jgi:hypothetical protein